jgi:hypothetical protein
MKRKIFAVAAAAFVIIGISGINASAWNNGPMGNGGHHGMMAGYQNGPVNQQLLEDTKAARTKIAADQVELNALMAGPNPDSKRARELSESIAVGQLELEKAYGGAGYGGNGHHGYGMMNSGYGCW